MSEQDEPGLESLHGDDQAPSVSTSWGYFLGGSTVLALIALTGSAVLAQFLEHRPVNLCPLTQHFASLIDETIRDHYVPEENIHRAEPELRRDDRSALFFYAFEVEVPPQLNPEKIAGMVRDSLHQRMLEVQEMPVENALTGLSLAISGREFARIVFRVPKVVAPAPLEDLRAPATHLAQEMFAFFVAQGIPEKNIVQESAQEQRDESAIWVQTVLRASAQDAVPWTQWLAALAQQSMQHNAEIRQSTAPTGESAIEGWLAQRLAVRAI